MKNIDWHKTFKTIGIILIVVLVILYFDYKSTVRINKTYDKVSDLEFVSEGLGAIEDLCNDAMNSADYDDMYNALFDIKVKCNELEELVDNAADYFTPVEPDYD